MRRCSGRDAAIPAQAASRAAAKVVRIVNMICRRKLLISASMENLPRTAPPFTMSTETRSSPLNNMDVELSPLRNTSSARKAVCPIVASVLPSGSWILAIRMSGMRATAVSAAVAFEALASATASPAAEAMAKAVASIECLRFSTSRLACNTVCTKADVSTAKKIARAKSLAMR